MNKLTLLIVLALLIQATAFSQFGCTCLPDGITFTTQEQIDNFQTNYSNCTKIEGDVEIYGNNISNLNGLNVLTSFGGSLLIGRYMGSSPAFTSLSGLDNVTSIGGDLWIRNNIALTSLTGLDNLTSVEGDLIIEKNSVLTSLAGMDNVTSVDGDLIIEWNSVLPNLIGLNNVTSIGRILKIYH